MKYLSLVFSVLFTVPVMAQNIIVGGTRFVYPANEKEITISLTNSGDSPALAQVWLDNGDSSVAPENINTPFVISPPMVRIDGSQAQVIRIKAETKSAFPRDRESLLWLNVLDIPASSEEAAKADVNILEMAIRSRFKFFWRPAGLGDRQLALDKLELRTAGRNATIINPTPFYITIGSLSRKAGPELLGEAVMVAPKNQQTVSLTAAVSAGESLKLEEINDYGGITSTQIVTR
ncbi:molecular chaperone [Shimwellia pseudoproteus]|nr:molecular chaperone [Shimwellia pseudoproteus]